MKKLFIALLLSFFINNIYAQVDTSFWFAVPYVTGAHAKKPVYLRLATFGRTNINISQPANPNPSGYSRDISVLDAQSISIDLTPYLKDYLEDSLIGVPLNRGLHIKSDGPITAYYEVLGTTSEGIRNSDIFVLKGTNALGTEFYTPFQNKFANDVQGDTLYSWYQNDAYSSIDIVATEDGSTLIDITPTKDVIGPNRDTVRAGTTFQISLTKGQTYSIRALGRDPVDHLTGTYIKSNKKIAVTIKDDSVKGIKGDSLGFDLIGDQIVPINVVGREYLVTKGYMADSMEHVFIVPTVNGTNITINGIQVASNLQAGSNYAHLVTGNAHIITDYPSYVFHITGVDNEFGGALLPTINCTGSTSVSFMRGDKTTFTLNILVKIIRGDETKYFKITSSRGEIVIPEDVFVNAPEGGWKMARLDGNSPISTQIDTGLAYFLKNDSAFFHMGIMNGSNNTSGRYGYFSDFGKLHVDDLKDKSICPEAPITFSASTRLYNKFAWTINGDTLARTSSFTPPSNINGRLILTVWDYRECKANDTMNYVFYPGVSVNLGTIPQVCYETNYTFNASTGATQPQYFWNNGNVAATSSLTYSQVTKDTSVSITVVDINGCKGNTSATLKPYPRTSVDLGHPDSTICYHDTIKIVANPNNFNQYEWYLNESLLNNSTSEIQPTQSGKYKLRATDGNNCSVSDSIDIRYIAIGDLPIDIGPGRDTLCWYENGAINASPTNYPKYEWFFNGSKLSETGSTINPSQTGLYKLVVTDINKCNNNDSIDIRFVKDEEIALELGPGREVCSYQNYTLNAGPATGFKFRWNNGPLTNEDTYIPKASGTYKVEKIFDIGGCKKEDEVNIVYVDTIRFTLPDANICPGKMATVRATNTDFASYLWSNNSQDSILRTDVEGSYTLEVTTKIGGCKGYSSVNIREHKIIPLELGFEDTIVCKYSNFTIHAGPSYKKYLWEPFGESDSIITPTNTGLYKVTATDFNGCNQSDEVKITLISMLKPQLGPDRVLCSDHEFMLTPSKYFSTYLWSTGDTTKTLTPEVKHNGDVWLKVSTVGVNERTGVKTYCYSSDTVNIKVVAPITVDLGRDTTVCSYYNFNLVAENNSSWPGTTYLWNNGSTSKTVKPESSGKYSVTVIGEGNCEAKDEVSISYIKNPILPEEPTICERDSFVFDIGKEYSNYNITWLNENNEVIGSKTSLVARNEGEYKVMVDGQCGSNSSHGRLYVMPLPNIGLGKDTSFCLDPMNHLILRGGFSKDYDFVWKNLDEPTYVMNDSVIDVYNTGNYELTVIDKISGCINKDTVYARIHSDCFKVPNLITPNGDEHNQKFKILGIEGNTWKLEIFNRWGDRVYHSLGYNNDWEADNVSDGVYYYHLEHPHSNNTHKGWLQVLGKQKHHP